MTTTTTPVVPSVHVRALATWATIFPLVAIGMTLMAPVSADWHPIARAFVLTAVIVPLAVYWIVPRVLALYMRRSAVRSTAVRSTAVRSTAARRSAGL